MDTQKFQNLNLGLLLLAIGLLAKIAFSGVEVTVSNNAVTVSNNAAIPVVTTPDHATKWELAVESIPDLEWDTKATELGDNGWSIVSARRAVNSITDTYSYECIMQRPKAN